VGHVLFLRRIGAAGHEDDYQIGACLAKEFAGRQSSYVGCSPTCGIDDRRSSLLDREFGGADVVMLL
jgi:hypothetical protein